MLIYIDSALIKTYQEPVPVAKAFCKQTDNLLGQMPTHIQLQLTDCGRIMFDRHQDAKTFLWFVFKSLTGKIPPDTALIVPVLQRVTTYA